jgi:Cu(I)-responsive transcriptional regulator
MHIGRLAQLTGVSAKMIRHYEESGLTPKASRTMSGYRIYTENDVHTVRFVRQARDLGFSTKQIAELLSLWRDRRRSSSKVKILAQEQIRDLEQRLLQMQSIKATLEHLVHCCRGDDRPECPILDALATSWAPKEASRRSPIRIGGSPRTAKVRR